MSADVEECFKRIIENRNPPKIEPMVDGRSGFLFLIRMEAFLIRFIGSIISSMLLINTMASIRCSFRPLLRMYAVIPIVQTWLSPE